MSHEKNLHFFYYFYKFPNIDILYRYKNSALCKVYTLNVIVIVTIGTTSLNRCKPHSSDT